MPDVQFDWTCGVVLFWRVLGLSCCDCSLCTDMSLDIFVLCICKLYVELICDLSCYSFCIECDFCLLERPCIVFQSMCVYVGVDFSV